MLKRTALFIISASFGFIAASHFAHAGGLASGLVTAGDHQSSIHLVRKDRARSRLKLNFTQSGGACGVWKCTWPLSNGGCLVWEKTRCKVINPFE